MAETDVAATGSVEESLADDGLGRDVFLEEDAACEPTAREVEDYARFLGAAGDASVTWIVREALRAPLPPPWRACCAAETGDLYYFNPQNGATRWTHPLDEAFRVKVAYVSPVKRPSGEKRTPPPKPGPSKEDVALVTPGGAHADDIARISPASMSSKAQ